MELESKKADKNLTSIARSYGNLALYHGQIDEYELVFENFKKALSITIEALGNDHPSLSIIYTNIGAFYGRMQKNQKCIENYQKALAISIKHKGNNHPEVARVYNNLGIIF